MRTPNNRRSNNTFNMNKNKYKDVPVMKNNGIEALESRLHNTPIYKFNGGVGALLCSSCRTIIKTGELGDITTAQYCNKCEFEYEISNDK